MTRARQYDSGPAFRNAIEEHIKRISRDEAVDVQRLRRQIAFDRFLARLFSGDRSDWILKGGYAMELRFQVARATRDLDFTVRGKPSGAGDTVLTLLQDAGAHRWACQRRCNSWMRGASSATGPSTEMSRTID